METEVIEGGVTAEQRAQMAIKLEDDVRALIRKEVKALLTDFNAGSELGHALASTFIYALSYRLGMEPQFKESVRAAMKQIVDKY